MPSPAQEACGKATGEKRGGEGSEDYCRQPRTTQQAYRVARHRQASEVTHTAVILCILVPPASELPAPILFTLATVAGA